MFVWQSRKKATNANDADAEDDDDDAQDARNIVVAPAPLGEFRFSPSMLLDNDLTTPTLLRSFIVWAIVDGALREFRLTVSALC